MSGTPLGLVERFYGAGPAKYVTRFRALHGPAISSITFRVEEDHDGQAALRDRTDHRLMGMAGLWKT
jgi:hypothetical protein